MPTSFNYVFPSNKTYTYGKCVGIDEKRVIIGGHSESTTGGYHRGYYSDSNDPTAGYDVNYFHVGSADQDWLYSFNARSGFVMVKERSIYIKNTVQEDGIQDTQVDANINQIADVK